MPPPAPPIGTEPRTTTNRWPLVIALVCILAAIVAVYFTHPRTETDPLLRFLSGTFETRSLQEVSAAGLSTVTLPVSGKVLEYTRSSREAAIVLEDDGGQAVYLLGGEPELISTSVTPKSALALSEDGTYLAYAERQSESEGTTAGEFYAADAWVVHTYSVESRKRQVLGVGYAPQFFTREGEQYVAYTTPFGLRFVNVVSNIGTDLSVQFPPSDSRAVPTISPDGKYLVLPNIAASRFSLFELTYGDGVFSLSPRGELLLNTSSVAFSGGKMYGASRNNTETFFYVADPTDVAGAVEIARIPLSTVYALIP